MDKYIDTQDLKKYSVVAQDGEIGSIEDLYFDDDLFYLRYLVIDTEPFLFRNLVLVSPLSFHKIDSEKEKVDLYITKKELEDSPKLSSNQMISRRYEEAFNNFYSYPHDWGNVAATWVAGPYGIPWGYYEQTENKNAKDQENEGEGLKSANALRSYSIKGKDGTFGHIQGFIINPLSLAIDFIVVDTINYLPSKLVLVRPEWIKNVSRQEQTIELPFDKELIKSAPAYSNGELDKKLISKNDKHFDKDEDTGEADTFTIKKSRAKLKGIPDKEVVVGHIPSGLFVVTVPNKESNTTESFLASWVQQASFDPLLVSIAIKDKRPGIESILEKNSFCINVLGENNSKVLETAMNKPNDLNFTKKNGSLAFLKKAKSALICKAHEISHPGDHYLVTAEVTEGIVLHPEIDSKTHQRKSGNHY